MPVRASWAPRLLQDVLPLPWCHRAPGVSRVSQGRSRWPKIATSLQEFVHPFPTMFTISSIAISLCGKWIEVVVFQSSGSNRRRSFLGNCTVMRVRKPPAPATSRTTPHCPMEEWILSRVSSVLGCSTCFPKAIYLEESAVSPKPLAWELAVLCIWHSILQVLTLPMKESVQYESVK